jgi:hypothetical protein
MDSDSVITLVATIIGAALGFGLTRLEQWVQTKPLRRNAGMRLATDLRRWSDGALNALEEARIYRDSLGAAGSTSLALPVFGYESCLDQIALVDRDIATLAFELLHKRDQAVMYIGCALDHGDDDDGYQEFQRRTAKLIIEVNEVYRLVAASVGWPHILLKQDEKERLIWQAAPLPSEVERSSP